MTQSPSNTSRRRSSRSRRTRSRTGARNTQVRSGVGPPVATTIPTKPSAARPSSGTGRRRWCCAACWRSSRPSSIPFSGTSTPHRASASASSACPLARFVSANFRDEREATGALSGTSLCELQSPHARRGADGWIGLGWFIDHDQARGLHLSHTGFTGGSSSYVALSPALEVGVIVLTNFSFEPARRVGDWLFEEAIRTARAEIVPSAYEARTWFERGDWGNAAWAYAALADLVPDRSDYRERAEQARARCD